MSDAYVHGYRPRENERLQDQAQTLVDLLHIDTAYPAGSVVLEAGCGVGAQTVTLARRSPDARFISIDRSADSLAEAKRTVDAAGLTNVEFQQADIFALSFTAESFDHVFVCFVLEHLAQPVEALTTLKKLLKPGGTMTVIEGDHGSAYFHPDSSAARLAIRCQVELQRLAGGNALIGRQLYPLMLEAGLEAVHVSPRMVYVDSSRPDLVDGFTRKTFTAMIEGVREAAIGAGLIEAEAFDEGVRDLHRTAEQDGVFCYTFFKGVGRRSGLASIDLRVVGADDWRLWRGVRLEALREAPYAFGSTLAEWQGEGDTEMRWRARLSTVAFNVLAYRDGKAAGMVSATAANRDGTSELISMWVAPFARGRGVGDALVAAVADWARGRRAANLELAVVESNERARVFYGRVGFVDVGPLDVSHSGAPERRMILDLTGVMRGGSPPGDAIRKSRPM